MWKARTLKCQQFKGPATCKATCPVSAIECLKLLPLFCRRLCHPASLAAVGTATPRCDTGRQARSGAKGLQAPGAGAGAGLCVDVYAYTATQVS